MKSGLQLVFVCYRIPPHVCAHFCSETRMTIINSAAATMEWNGMISGERKTKQKERKNSIHSLRYQFVVVSLGK